MLSLCHPVLSRFLPVSLVLFPDRLERAVLFVGLPCFRSARSYARSPEACRPVLAGLRFFFQLDLVRGSPEACQPVLAGLLFFFDSDLVRDRLKRVDLSSLGFLFLVQLSCARIA